MSKLNLFDVELVVVELEGFISSNATYLKLFLGGPKESTLY